MTDFSADTLEEAYTKAAKELGVSIIDLDIEIIQNASKGFLGMFSKKAIISACLKGQRVQKPSKSEAVQKQQRRPLQL